MNTLVTFITPNTGHGKIRRQVTRSFYLLKTLHTQPSTLEALEG